MAKHELKSEIQKLLQTTPITSISSKLKLSHRYRHLYDELVKETAFLNPYNPTTTERIYCLVNDIKDRPRCKVCGTAVKFAGFNDGYQTYCSQKCAAQDPEWKRKREQTNKIRYGAKSPLSKNSIIYNKVKEGVIEKYGVDNVQKSTSVRKKTEQTIKNRYGVNHIMQVNEIKEKVLLQLRKTVEREYGVDNAAKHPDVKSKISQAHKSEKTKQKTQQTLRKKYGGEYTNVSQIPEVKEKIYRTMQERYGRWYGQQNIDHIDQLYDVNFLRSRFVNEENTDTDIIAMATYFNIAVTTAYHYAHKFGLPISKKAHTSRFEDSVIDFIQQLGYQGEIQRNVRGLLDKFEADIYLPELNLVIETDGVHWHSVGKYPFDNTMNLNYEKYRLYRKVNVAHKLGLDFLNIRDAEWYDKIKGRIWRSMIRNKLNLSSRIYARKCKIVNLSWAEANEFLIKNHLQGAVKGSSINVGLMYDSQLVAVMTVGKARTQKYRDYFELYRFANLIDTTVVGAASRLLNYVRETYGVKRLISYANRRWSSGSVYKRLGFKFEHTTMPGYVYVSANSYRIISRQTAMKENLPTLLDNFDPNKTELQNMFDNNWRVLYDAGNYLFSSK